MTRGWLLALLLSSALALAAPCEERCASNVSRCSSACGSEAKCATRCTDQLDRCTSSCQKGKARPQPLPAKCQGAGGKSIPCGDYYKAPVVTEPPIKNPPRPK